MRFKYKGSRDTRLIKLYIFVALYSSLLRLYFGKWSTVIADVLLVLLLISIFYNKGSYSFKVSNKFKGVMIAILMLTFVALLEIFNPNINNTLYSLVEFRKSIFQILSVFIGYFYMKQDRYEFNRVIRFLEISSLPIIVYGIKQYLYWTAIDDKLYALNDANFYTGYYDGHIRSISIFSGPFHYGMFCALIIVVSSYLWIIEKKKIHIVPMILSIIGCYCSITRTNLVSSISVLILAFFFFIAIKNTRELLLKKIMLIIGIFSISMFFILINPEMIVNNELLSNMFKSLTNISTDTRFMGRIDTWFESIGMIAKHPLIGNGMGSAGDTLGLHNIAIINTTPHNIVLKIFVETGVIGGGVFIYIMVKFLSMILRIKSNEIKYLLLGVSLCVYINGMVGSTISTFPVMTIFWILMGMGYAQGERTAKNKGSTLSVGGRYCED